jgi:hypothetical protein
VILLCCLHKTSLSMDASSLTETISEMHAAFVRISEHNCLPWAYDRYWYELAKAGYTANDVSIFLLWVKAENMYRPAQMRRRYHIPKMFGDLAEFDADLHLARAWARNIPALPTARQQALQELRPVVDPELAAARLRPAQRAGEVLQRLLGSAPEPPA